MINNIIRVDNDTGKVYKVNLNKRQVSVDRVLANGQAPKRFQNNCTGILNHDERNKLAENLNVNNLTYFFRKVPLR